MFELTRMSVVAIVLASADTELAMFFLEWHAVRATSKKMIERLFIIGYKLSIIAESLVGKLTSLPSTMGNRSATHLTTTLSLGFTS